MIARWLVARTRARGLAPHGLTSSSHGWHMDMSLAVRNAIAPFAVEACLFCLLPDCSIAGHPEIFVIGDVAHFADPETGVLPGVAPVAMQQGRHVADAIQQRLAGREAGAFHYRDRGSMATIGRKAAVADFGSVRFSGLPAWLLWSAVHILFLIEFESRVLVSIRWVWNYVTRNRGTRLITGADTEGDAPAPQEGGR